MVSSEGTLNVTIGLKRMFDPLLGRGQAGHDRAVLHRVLRVDLIELILMQGRYAKHSADAAAHKAAPSARPSAPDEPQRTALRITGLEHDRTLLCWD
jgi:hypothetical protein